MGVAKTPVMGYLTVPAMRDSAKRLARPNEVRNLMSEKRRDGVWTEAVHNEEVAGGPPRKVPHPEDGRAVPSSVQSAAYERIDNS